MERIGTRPKVENADRIGVPSSKPSGSVGFRGLRLQGAQRYLYKRKESASRQAGQEESCKQTCLRSDELEWKSERGRCIDREGD